MTTYEYNQELLVRLKEKRRNLDIQIENLEHRLKNLERARKARQTGGQSLAEGSPVEGR